MSVRGRRPKPSRMPGHLAGEHGPQGCNVARLVTGRAKWRAEADDPPLIIDPDRDDGYARPERDLVKSGLPLLHPLPRPLRGQRHDPFRARAEAIDGDVHGSLLDGTV